MVMVIGVENIEKMVVEKTLKLIEEKSKKKGRKVYWVEDIKEIKPIPKATFILTKEIGYFTSKEIKNMIKRLGIIGLDTAIVYLYKTFPNLEGHQMLMAITDFFFEPCKDRVMVRSYRKKGLPIVCFEFGD